jgi:hypothetical protein
MHLEADYRAGRLTEQQEQRYERICLDLHRLYRDAS